MIYTLSILKQMSIFKPTQNFSNSYQLGVLIESCLDLPFQVRELQIDITFPQLIVLKILTNYIVHQLNMICIIDKT